MWPRGWRGRKLGVTRLADNLNAREKNAYPLHFGKTFKKNNFGNGGRRGKMAFSAVQR